MNATHKDFCFFKFRILKKKIYQADFSYQIIKI